MAVTLVPRPHLTASIRAADPLALTIVVGAPGTGKTSLLAEWYHSVDDGTVAWMSADTGDDDPTRFWRGFIRALQQVESGFGQEADDLITLDGRATADTLECLLDDDHRLPARLRLVIDDFHLVSLDAAQQLQHLLHRGLRNVRLVLGSRSDPAVGLHRLRLQGAVHEIRDPELRLDLDQTRVLVANIGVDTAAIDIGALHERTAGWAAGVQMAALSLLGASDPGARARQIAGSTQTIAGYLTGEVLASQTHRVRRFLENTCVADVLDAALCRALMSEEPAEVEPVTLQEIEALHLLLSRVDAAGTVYRYHPLFRELLMSLGASSDPDHLRHQHALAAQHFEQRGAAIDAIRHHFHAGERAIAARMASDNAIAVFLHPGPPPPFDPNHTLDDDELRTSPGDAVGHALTHIMHGRPDLAREVLQRADRALADVHAREHLVDRAHLHAVRVGAELQFGDPATALAHAERLLELVELGDVPVDQWVIAALPFALRSCGWQERFDLADRLRTAFRVPPNRALTEVELAGALAFVDLERGDVRRAASASQRVRDSAVVLGMTGGGADRAGRSTLGVALLEQGNVAAAAIELASVLDHAPTERLPSLAYAAVGMARSLRCEARFDDAFEVLDTTRQRVMGVGTATTCARRIDLAELDLRLATSDLAAAAALLDRVGVGWRASLARSRFELAAGRGGAAEEHLRSVEPTTPRQDVLVGLQSIAVAMFDEAGAARVDRLADAVLDVAESAGMLLPIAEAGGGVLQAVKMAARRRDRSEFIERLLATPPLPLPTAMATPRSKADELSSRELVVLRYIATSMSNQEIADELFVSVNTVKTHIKHVLRKLDAGSRADAVQKARAAQYL